TNTYQGKGYGDYYVFGNALDVAGAYPGFFDNTQDPSQQNKSEGWAVFGETYYQATDSLKFTLGLRYNDDKREDYGTSVLFNSFDLNGALGGALGTTTFGRTSLGGFLGGAPLGNQTPLAKLYGVTDAQIAAANLTGPASPQRIALITAIPSVPQPAETRYLTGSPTEFEFKEYSGRAGVDWALDDDKMV
ncbi:MAG: hypothetical protein NT024_00165, partial [Proteobacteria bacterium]|nr:hypothetical protein [Pseudomonadota bacterium]